VAPGTCYRRRMGRWLSRLVLACACSVALGCRHAPPSIPDQAQLHTGVDRPSGAIERSGIATDA